MNQATDHNQWQEITTALEQINERLERIEEKLTQPSDEGGPEWLSIKAAAQTTGLSQSHIRRAVKSSRLKNQADIFRLRLIRPVHDVGQVAQVLLEPEQKRPVSRER